MIRIVLVDDHELVRAGIRMILGGQADMEVIGEASDGLAGLKLIRETKPDIALVDVHMPRMTGIELTDRVRRGKLDTRVVILTVLQDAPFPRRLLEAGAAGYLTKACSSDELVLAVRQVMSGRRYLSSSVAEALALNAIDGDGGSPFDRLTVRELDVALMLAQGQDMREIAVNLSLSPKTVATHKYRLFDKLEINNNVALAHMAHVHGLLDARALDLAPAD